MVFKEFLRKHVAPMILAGTMSGTIISFKPIVTSAKENSSIINISEENVKESDYFKTQEEVENWIDNEISNLSPFNDITSVEIYLYKGLESTSETIILDEIHYSMASVTKRLEQLKENGFYHDNIDITTFSYRNISINSSIEELKKYKEYLGNSAYLNIMDTISPFTVVKEDMILKISEETLEHLEIKISEFIEKQEKNNRFIYDFRIVKSANENKNGYIATIYRRNLVSNYGYRLKPTINEEIITAYHLKGEMTKIISKDRYIAKIIYEPIVIIEEQEKSLIKK